MITAKFGGTAVTAHNANNIKKLVTQRHKAVVVSAIGKTHPNDVKTTDLLKMYHADKQQAHWQQICNRYKQLVLTNGIHVDVEQLLFDAKKRATMYDQSYAMSLGEELSAKIVAKYLNFAYVEAQECIFFSKGHLQLNKSILALKRAFSGVKQGVIGGFYGGCASGRQIFSRGGSDVTGSLCAIATNSLLYENWTDVCGVCQANPLKISGAKPLQFLSYRQMYLLAKCGASVLHPNAVKLLEKPAIPLKVGNFLCPVGNSTTISNAHNNATLLCVAQTVQGANSVYTIAHNMTLQRVSSCLQSLEKQMRAGGNVADVWQISSVKLFPQIAQIVSKKDIYRQVFDAFSLC